MTRPKVEETRAHTTAGSMMNFPTTKHGCTPPTDISNVHLMCSPEALSTNPTKHRLLHTPTPTQHRGDLDGRKAWIRPRAWFVLHLVAAQLFQTIRLEPAATDHPTCCWPCASRQPLQHTYTLETYLTVPSSSPDSWPFVNFCQNKSVGLFSGISCSLEGFFPLLLLIAVDYCDTLERLTFQRSHNLFCVAARSLWAWWCSWSAKIKWEEALTDCSYVNDSLQKPYISSFKYVNHVNTA